MTPLGHISVAYLIAVISKKKLLLSGILIGGIIPDIDFVFIFFSWFNAIHRTVTHNLLFIITVAYVAGLFFRTEKIKIFFSILAGGVMHFLIDSVMDNNSSNGIGVNIFWPFINYYFSPFNLTPPAVSSGLVRREVLVLYAEGILSVIALIVWFKNKKSTDKNYR